jgi:hypothetical protein
MTATARLVDCTFRYPLSDETNDLTKIGELKSDLGTGYKVVHFIFRGRRPSQKIEGGTSLEQININDPHLQARTVDLLSSNRPARLQGATSIEEVSDSAFKRANQILLQHSHAESSEESDTQLYEQINAFVQEFGRQAITALTPSVLLNKATQDTICTVLQILGRLESNTGYQRRLWLLERMLTSSYPRIRYGAALGIAYLDDEHAIPYIHKALEQEPIPDLKGIFNKLLVYLKK